MSSEESSKSALFLNEYADVAAFKDSACTTVMKLIRSSNDLSRASDHDFLMSFAPLGRRMDSISEKVLQQMKFLLKQVNVRYDLGFVSCKEADHEEKIEKLIDANDVLFERISSAFDEAAGLKKNQTEVTTLVPSIRNVSATWNKSSIIVPQQTIISSKPKFDLQTKQKRNQNSFSISHQQTKNIPKPQLKFTDKVNNNPLIPFIPKLRSKPNARTPLPKIFNMLDSQQIDSTLFENHPELLSNPYLDEIEAFQPDESLLKPVEPKLPKPIDQTKCSFVDTVEKLEIMMKHLEQQTELAVDLEHHSFRSYQGFTCLIQISSRSEDFLIDAIALRDHLQILNHVFTDPKVVKVFHGADSDIEWLQKDFGVYVVNMFDTHQAARVLNLSALSLAFLLKSHCDIDANKQFQVADWRIRPLPADYLHYAREDTHYLLYIHDRLRNNLLQIRQNNPELLQEVFQRSKNVCEKSYKKPFSDLDAYQIIYQKSRKLFNVRQLAALKSLYHWRDQIARQEDESTGYVLPNHMLLQMSEILPREAQGIRACCNPVPLLVQHNVHDIHQIILRARDIPLIEEPREQQSAPITLPVTYDPDSVLYCPHDISHIDQQNSFAMAPVPASINPITTKLYSKDLTSLLDAAFIDESKKRSTPANQSTLIEIKRELLPTKKPVKKTVVHLFDQYVPEPFRISSIFPVTPLWKIYYPSRDPTVNGKSHQTASNQNGTSISREKPSEDIEKIMLSKQSNGKRKRKGNHEDIISNKAKQKRYRRAAVDDEIPAAIVLDNNDDEDEEPGEIIPEETSSNRFEPFNYQAIDEKTILSSKKFKRPANDEDIYEPNRPTKSSTVKAPKRPGAQQAHKSISYPFPKKK